MFKSQVTAAEGVAPYNTYDSVLEKPNGNDPNQNAWLTLQLRVKLNFADSKNPVDKLIVKQGDRYFAKDWNGYLFPILDWPPFLMTRFQREFIQVAEKTWNWQFQLITPRNYSELDFQSFAGAGWTVRPNVLCLFRMSLQGPSGALDSSPAAGPMRAGSPHRIINVVNLDLRTRQVSLKPGVAATAANPATKNVEDFNSRTWRSDSGDYDDSDLFSPAWKSKEHHVLGNTVGHEVGHALGQCHIMGLHGTPGFGPGGALENTPGDYGEGSADPFDPWNVMGGGDRVYLINAVSWRERIALHTGVPASQWDVTGLSSNTFGRPPRKMPIGFSALGVLPAEW